MFKRTGFFIFFICLSAIASGAITGTRAYAGESPFRYIYTSSALIIVLQNRIDTPLSARRYTGFSPGYKIGPYIHPAYLEPVPPLRFQRYTGFKNVYKDQCYQCQRYTGFKKTYRGQRYTGFTNDYSPFRFSPISYWSIFQTY